MEPSSREELLETQDLLGGERPPLWQPAPGAAVTLGACFAIFEKGVAGPGAAGDRAWGSAIVLDGDRIADHALTEGRSDAQYEPGLLFLRVGHVLLDAVRGLGSLPAVLIVDGTGRDHPRRAGLALHLGAVLDVPTIGVTHRPLIAHGEWPAGDQTSTPLRLDAETVGYWLVTKPGTRPLAIHAGWRTDAETARSVVQFCVRRARTPEPLRIARQKARLARARACGELPPS
ncbi:MAG: endonuclease V [Chloroflexi bacterium]|nr:endonuclease V [Chloroflexota bacterium]